jgi:uncharacterized protein (TIGR02246 family)
MKLPAVMKFRVVCALALAFWFGRMTAQQNPSSVLMEADRQFDVGVAKGGAAAWASFFAEDGKMFLPDGSIVSGRRAIRQTMELSFAPGYRLRWRPTTADIAASGDLGYTTGESTIQSRDDKGKTVESRGRYVSIWKKQPDGTWKVAVDIGAGAGPRPASR